MTFILNILHKDMSILAADRSAIAEWPTATTSNMAVHAGGGSVVDDYEKITLDPRRTLALGIAGHTQDHSYLPSLKTSAGIDDVLWKIRKHIEGFVRVHDRSSLATLNSFAANEGIASFFDEAAGTYFSTKFRFSPIESQFRLHRGSDQAKILHAGSGSSHFEQAVGQAGIDDFVSSTKRSCTPESCVSWMKEAYRRVSLIDVGTGSEPVFAVSTRSSPEFRFLIGC
jgi:hypothetical protein